MTELEFTKELLQIQNYLLSARDEGIVSAWEITAFLLQDLVEKVNRGTAYLVRAEYMAPAHKHHALLDTPEFKELVQEVEKHVGGTIDLSLPSTPFQEEKFDWDWVDMMRDGDDEGYYNFNGTWNPGNLF